MNAALLILFCVGQAAQPDGNDDNATAKAAKLRELVDQSIDAYEVYADAGNAKEPMKSFVALRWSNTTRDARIVPGLTILLTNEGRPEAVVSIFPWGNKLVHEFDSLSRGMVVARRNGIDVWRPRQPGITLQPIPDSPLPAKSAGGRLRQMKLLAKRFGATMLGWKSDDSDREELRLLPKPLYRYKSGAANTNALDGAVFSFVMGNDPEALVILEATGDEGGYDWQYAFVRQTSAGIEGTYRDKVVWTAKKFPRNDDPNSVHFSAKQPLEIK